MLSLDLRMVYELFSALALAGLKGANRTPIPRRTLHSCGCPREEKEEESLFKADAVNEEDSERDRATQV